jgi:hypothetical protein
MANLNKKYSEIRNDAKVPLHSYGNIFCYKQIFSNQKVGKSQKTYGINMTTQACYSNTQYHLREKLNQHSALVERALLIFNFTP